MKLLLLIILILGTTVCFVSCSASKKLTIGDKAPNFTAEDQNGKIVHLSDYLGKKVALYFFPKAHPLSMGCIKQSCNLRNDFPDLTERGIIILGFSNSPQESLKEFVKKNNLPFSLLHATRELFKAYGVKRDPRLLWTIRRRQTFLINEEGIIVNIIINVDVNNHAQQILDGFNKVAQ
jgi:thioredoxin-dependent peroxiredoxin